jgi:micrococcal nuclease
LGLLSVLTVANILTGCSPEEAKKTEEKASPPQETTVEETTVKAAKTSPEKTAREKTVREKTEREEEAREKTAEENRTAAATTDSEEEGDYEAVVTVRNVVDGDTVDVSPAIDGIERVRFIGVDTPETRECPGGQPLSQEAKAYTTTELLGQEVGLEFDVERTDRFDRLLAYVYEDEEMFNQDLLEEGYAQVATFPPNVRYLERFLAAQEQARAAGLGIWALSPEQLAQLEDRGNGIGGAGCATPAPPPKTKAPTPPQPPLPPPIPDVPPAPAAPRLEPTASIPPVSGNSCPPNAPIKGNQSGIYHVPGGGFYDRTNPEECFANEAEAQAAGYRASRR